MASNGIPIRLSAALATSARQAALIEDRSLTEQVEHWARLGQVVEEAVMTKTIRQLKATSYDERLPALLAYADTLEATDQAAELIRAIVRLDRAGSRTAGRVIEGRFEPAAAHTGQEAGLRGSVTRGKSARRSRR
jgi:hypothetical protein